MDNKKKAIPESVPISRFLDGEADKIFEEVRESGMKYVQKDDSTECILLSPKVYQQILDIIEEYNLLVEADHRLNPAQSKKYIEQDKVLSELKIKQEDLEDIIEIE